MLSAITSRRQQHDIVKCRGVALWTDSKPLALCNTLCLSPVLVPDLAGFFVVHLPLGIPRCRVESRSRAAGTLENEFALLESKRA